eukprot:gene63154-86388_t
MIGALIGPGRWTAVLAIGIFAIPVFVRVSNGVALRGRTLDFCLAAQAAGKNRLRITLDHILPNIAGAVIVQATIQIGLAILVEAGLGFLGLSLAPPAPSWGRMLSEAQTYLDQAPWMALAPGITIAVAVLGLNLLGDGLRPMTIDVDLRAIRLKRWGRPAETLVADIAFSIPSGSTLGIVGESGSGKSLTALAIMGLLPAAIRAEGKVMLDGTDLLTL